MAEPIGALRAELSANSAQFERDMGRARDAVRGAGRDMEASLGRVERAFNGAVKGLINLKTVAAAAAAGVAYLVKSNIDAADAMSKMAQKAGVPIEELSALAHAANLSDVSLEALGGGMAKLSKKMIEAAGGTKSALEPFDLLGIKLRDAEGNVKNAGEIIKELAEKFEGMEDGAGKTALAMEFFGKTGADMIPLLNSGAAGITQMEDEARKLGLTLTGETGKAAEAFNDSITRLMAVKTGFVNQVMQQVLPTLQALSDDLYAVAADEENLKSSAEVATTGLQLITSAGVVTIGVFKIVGKAFAAVAKILTDVVAGSFTQVGKLIGGVTASIAEAVSGNWEQAKDIMSMSLDDFRNEGTKRTAAIFDTAEMGMDSFVDDVGRTWDKLKNIWTPPKTGPDFWMNIWGDPGTGEQFKAKVEAPIIQAVETGKGKAKELKEKVYEIDIAYKDLAKSGEDSFAQLQQAIEGWGKDSADAIADFAMGGKASFSDMINSMIKDLLKMMIYQKITGPLFSAMGNWLGNLGSSRAMTSAGSYWDIGYRPSAHGNVFKSSGLSAYRNSIVSRPTVFPFAHGVGLMGEAGSEAIMPLTRTAGGDLGVNAAGLNGGTIKVEVINNTGVQADTNPRTSFDPQTMVVTVWLDAFKRNKMGLRDTLGG